MSINIGVTSNVKALQQRSFDVAAGRSVRLEIPEGFSDEHLQLAIRDLDILKDILTKYPKEFKEVVSAIAAGNFSQAQTIAKRVGITEKTSFNAEVAYGPSSL